MITVITIIIRVVSRRKKVAFKPYGCLKKCTQKCTQMHPKMHPKMKKRKQKLLLSDKVNNNLPSILFKKHF